MVANVAEKINCQKSFQSWQLVLLKWPDEHAKYHPNSVKMAIFFRIITKSPSGLDFHLRPRSMKRRKILALGSSPSPSAISWLRAYQYLISLDGLP